MIERLKDFVRFEWFRIVWGKRYLAAAALSVALLVWMLPIVPSALAPEIEQAQSVIEEELEATLNPQREHNLDDIVKVAAKIEAENGFPAEAMIAQWAVESDWGERPACRQNYFGVKKASRHTLSCSERTTEVFTARRLGQWNKEHPQKPLQGKPLGANFVVQMPQQFADYATLEDSCRDYAWLIMNASPYVSAWANYLKQKDAKKLMADLAGIYWTDPDYTRKALGVMSNAEVKDALAAARSPVLPSAPASQIPKGLPPVTVAGIAIALGNAAVVILAGVAKQYLRARHEEFRRRVDGIRTALEVKIADTDAGLQKRIEGTLETSLKAHTLDLMDRFNGRYLQTKDFNKAHAEMMAAIGELKSGMGGAL